MRKTGENGRRRSLLDGAGRLPVGAGNDGRAGPAMTFFVTPITFPVTPDVIGRLLLPGSGIAGGAGNDEKRGRQ